MKKAVAYHGWGFDRTCWAPWKAWLDLAESDRGYFHHRVHIDSESIILAHSYGLHLCPLEQLKQAETLILFGCFLKFHPLSQERRSRMMLGQMINQFEANPLAVLANFKAKSYHPQQMSDQEDRFLHSPPNPPCWGTSEPSAPGTSKSPSMGDLGGGSAAHPLNFDLLLQDLKDLDTCEFDIILLQQIPKILILHGSHDRIVSVAKGRELSQLLPDNSQYIEIEQAGHGLPFTHAQTCWDWIVSRL
jgi:pimeloyl-[acyl-carrier protein] methyl ester esterase